MLNARVASSFVFSVLIVAVTAVALYRPEPPPSEPLAEGSAFKAADAPPPTPGAARADPSGGSETDGPSKGSTAMVPNGQASPQEVIRSNEAAARTTGPSARPAFVRVEPGESLADVAVRVYGSTEAAASLWAANRDQLARPDEPLAPGSVLRAP
jgi:nucleoid-associated protein YgaU